MNFFNKKKIIVTHSGTFHADDVFACAVLQILLDKRKYKYKIIRTRDPEIIKNGNFVFDVGGEYDPSRNRFDHHQKDGAGKRDNGIPYAAFGLVWKSFGLELCDDDKTVWETIDNRIVSPVDATDNGVDIVTPKFGNVLPYSGEQPFLIFSPAWNEDQSTIDSVFLKQVEKVKPVLQREIDVAKADSLGRDLILKSYNQSIDKRIIELDKSFPRYLYQEVLSGLDEPIYVVYPSSHSKVWKVEAVTKNPNTLESRKLFPENWRGLLNEDEKLKTITGVSDVTFCHNSGFLVIVKSKEGAMKLAKIALQK